jgi:hypothetical protein
LLFPFQEGSYIVHSSPCNESKKLGCDVAV